VAVGDFNGDGALDLAVTNFNFASVSVLLGLGDGTFADARRFGVGSDPDSVAVGDFNGDGVLDLAVANYGTPPRFLDGSVSVLLGNEDGTFAAQRRFGVGSRPFSIAVGDFNGDGKPDLAVANSGTSPNYPDSSISVLLGLGDGTFADERRFGVGSNPDSVAVGDFNGDGALDLAVANGGSYDVAILLNNTRSEGSRY